MIAKKKKNQQNKKQRIAWYKRPSTIVFAVLLLSATLVFFINQWIYRESHVVVGEILSKHYNPRKYSHFSRSCTIHCLYNDTCLIFYVPIDYYDKIVPGDYVEIEVSDILQNHYRLNKKREPFRRQIDTSSFVKSIREAIK